MTRPCVAWMTLVMSARERLDVLLDEGSFRELLDPFDRVTSPWLPKQGIVTQADDGVVVAKGRVAEEAEDDEE